MSNKRKSLKNPRLFAHIQQNGKCYYCNHQMWIKSPTKFAKHYKVTLKQAEQRKCTGEHLNPHSDGGSASRNNIVAACLYCNAHRHMRKHPISVKDYKLLVSKKVSQGKWLLN